MPSILDRLLDDDPDVSTEPQWRQSLNLREYQQTVLRDIENLLNSRQARPELSVELPEASKSVLTYGMPDFAAAGVASQEERDQIRRAVQLAVERFEPRLRQVQVELHEPETRFDRKLRMTIRAVLWVQPNPQAITFDTIVMPSSGSCTVES
jgi:type VI secretion system protein ImpF